MHVLPYIYVQQKKNTILSCPRSQTIFRILTDALWLRSQTIFRILTDRRRVVAAKDRDQAGRAERQEPV